MDELELMVRAHKFTSNRNRTNISNGPTMKYGKHACLVMSVLSNTLRSGSILDHVQAMLGPQITCVCLNKNVPCAPHRDKKNAGESFVCYFGEFTGGALCLEDGRRFEGKRQWHGSFDGASLLHYNEPHEGEKFSIVAFV